MREILAAWCHEQWSNWMFYLFSKGTLNDDGTWTMPAWAAQRWYRQMNVLYVDLSEDEKDSDRNEADKLAEVLDKHHGCGYNNE